MALLSFLRLRDPDRAEGFQLLEVASEDSKKLAKEIRDLDDYMSRERPISPKIRFKINKPDSLSKMSDLSYALDLYLKGDKQAAAIEVAFFIAVAHAFTASSIDFVAIKYPLE